jgi:hypothetical protein
MLRLKLVKTSEEEAMVEKQKTFYTLFAEELIDNRSDVANVRLRMSTPRAELNQMIFDRTGDPRAGVSAHLTPTKRKKRMGIYFPLVFRADAESVSVCRHLCALCVKIAWSAQQQRGFATPRKESYAFQPT